MDEVRTCPLCESPSFEPLHRLRLEDRYPQSETKLQASSNYHRNYILFEKILGRQVPVFEVEFRVCTRCGLIYFSPRPSESDLAVKYQLIAEQGDTAAREELRRLVDLKALRSRRIREIVAPYLVERTGRAVDVGGADGHCLMAFVGELDCGILDFEQRDLAPGVAKLGNSLDDLDASDLFDLALSCHTLEHVPDVGATVSALTRHLVEGGLLYVEVPYGCAGEIYTTSNVLTHVNFFSEGSMGYLLESRGLHVERMMSGPVLSKKRFVPVVQAIARKDSQRPVAGTYLDQGYAITRRQMSTSIDRSVTVANSRLVLSHPAQYSVAFAAQLARRVGNQSGIRLRGHRVGA
jgi:hypothetical protein